MRNRNSNIEIVRFFSAVGILLGHSASKGQGILYSDGLYNLFFHVIGCFANMGSMILAMISFYFMWDKNFSSKRIFRIWFQTLFYYSVITILLLLLRKISINRDVVQYFFPVCGRPYWFVTAWIVFCLFRPIFDHILKVINNYKCVCIYTTILFYVVPFLFTNSVLNDELTLFIALYSLTVYLINVKKKINRGGIYRYIYCCNINNGCRKLDDSRAFRVGIFDNN